MTDAAGRQAEQLADALAALSDFEAGDLTARISALESLVAHAGRDEVDNLLKSERISGSTMSAALLVKVLSRQIDVVVHAIGILTALPFILEPAEQIKYVSLGAGNTGRPFDLETNIRVAEFTFISWRGGPESIRQNKLFVDLFNLASASTTKRRVLYVVGRVQPLAFLTHKRALRNVLSRNAGAAAHFERMHGDAYRTVGEYFASVRDLVEIIDLADVVPGLQAR